MERLNDDECSNYGISQSDMYQMYAYAKKYNTSEIWLLYPRINEVGDRTDISFRIDDGVNVRVYFIDVANIEDSIEKLKILIS